MFLKFLCHQFVYKTFHTKFVIFSFQASDMHVDYLFLREQKLTNFSAVHILREIEFGSYALKSTSPIRYRRGGQDLDLGLPDKIRSQIQWVFSRWFFFSPKSEKDLISRTSAEKLGKTHFNLWQLVEIRFDLRQLGKIHFDLGLLEDPIRHRRGRQDLF